MSIKLMTQVWECELSHPDQSILLAMADHANDFGEQCYPSIPFLAWKTGYSERQVKRIIGSLKQRKVVTVLVEATSRRPPCYKLHLDRLPRKAPFVRQPDDTPGGDKMSPQNDAPGVTSDATRDDILDARGDISGVRGDIAMSPEPPIDPSLVEPSEEPIGGAGAPRPSDDVSEPPSDDQAVEVESEREFVEALCWVCYQHMDVSSLPPKRRIALREEAKKLRAQGYSRKDLRRWFLDFWQKSYPRRRPWVADVSAGIAAVRHKRFEEAVLTPAPPPQPPVDAAPQDPTAALWAEVLRDLSATHPALRDWLYRSSLRMEDDCCTIVLGRKHVREWLEHQATPLVRRILSVLLRRPVTVRFVEPDESPALLPVVVEAVGQQPLLLN